MAKISEEFQQKLRKYGQSLHVSLREIFFEFAEASKFEKQIIQLLRPKIKRVASQSSPLDFDKFMEMATEMPEIDQSFFGKAIRILRAPIEYPLVLIVFAPVIYRLAKKHVIWNSEPHSLILAAILGSLLDSSKSVTPP